MAACIVGTSLITMPGLTPNPSIAMTTASGPERGETNRRIVTILLVRVAVLNFLCVSYDFCCR